MSTQVLYRRDDKPEGSVCLQTGPVRELDEYDAAALQKLGIKRRAELVFRSAENHLI